MFELQRRPLSYVWNFEKDFEKLLNGKTATVGWQSQSEIIENEKQYIVSVDMAGVKKEDVKIDLNDNVLEIMATRKSAEKKEEEKVVYQQRFYGEFKQSFSLPDSVNLEEIQAGLEHGVLTITIPKLEKKQARTIQIN